MSNQTTARLPNPQDERIVRVAAAYAPAIEALAQIARGATSWGRPMAARGAQELARNTLAQLNVKW